MEVTELQNSKCGASKSVYLGVRDIVWPHDGGNQRGNQSVMPHCGAIVLSRKISSA